MKLELAPGRARLRLARAEFDHLRAGRALSLALRLPGGCWDIDIVRSDAFSASLAGTRLALEIPGCDLDVLHRRLPSRDGLRWIIDIGGVAFETVLEVDIRDRPPSADAAR